MHIVYAAIIVLLVGVFIYQGSTDDDSFIPFRSYYSRFTDKIPKAVASEESMRKGAFNPEGMKGDQANNPYQGVYNTLSNSRVPDYDEGFNQEGLASFAMAPTKLYEGATDQHGNVYQSERVEQTGVKNSDKMLPNNPLDVNGEVLQRVSLTATDNDVAMGQHNKAAEALYGIRDNRRMTTMIADNDEGVDGTGDANRAMILQEKDLTRMVDPSDAGNFDSTTATNDNICPTKRRKLPWWSLQFGDRPAKHQDKLDPAMGFIESTKTGFDKKGYIDPSQYTYIKQREMRLKGLGSVNQSSFGMVYTYTKDILQVPTNKAHDRIWYTRAGYVSMPTQQPLAVVRKNLIGLTTMKELNTLNNHVGQVDGISKRGVNQVARQRDDRLAQFRSVLDEASRNGQLDGINLRSSTKLLVQNLNSVIKADAIGISVEGLVGGNSAGTNNVVPTNSVMHNIQNDIVNESHESRMPNKGGHKGTDVDTGVSFVAKDTDITYQFDPKTEPAAIHRATQVAKNTGFNYAIDHAFDNQQFNKPIATSVNDHENFGSFYGVDPVAKRGSFEHSVNGVTTF